MKLNKKLLKEICDYLGSDLDDPKCQEIRKQMEASPNCKAFFEKIKITVDLIHAADQYEPIPDDLQQKLLQCLKIKTSKK